MKQLEVHPAADIFPLMRGADFDAFVEDIKLHGLREPIIIHENAILDGRNRYRACVQLGLEPPTQEWDGSGTAVAYVISKNLYRRHLNESQRALIGAGIANMKSGTRTDLRPTPNLEEVSVPQAAAMLNVSPASIYNAKTVLRESTEEEIKAVEMGETTVSAAARKIKERQKNGDLPVSMASSPAKGVKLTAIPEGETIESLCRKGIEKHGDSLVRGSVAAGLSRETYSMALRLVFLSERSDLSGRDQELVSEMLRLVNETKQISNYYTQISPIASRVWGPSRSLGGASLSETEQRHRQRFRRAFDTLTSVLAAADQITIAQLDAAATADCIMQLEQGEKALRRFKAKLKEMHP